MWMRYRRRLNESGGLSKTNEESTLTRQGFQSLLDCGSPFFEINREGPFPLAPYGASVPLSVGIFLYIRRHRYVPGARTHLLIVGGPVLTTLCFISEWSALDWSCGDLFAIAGGRQDIIPVSLLGMHDPN